MSSGLQILFLLVSGGPDEGLRVLEKVKNTCDGSQIWLKMIRIKIY